MSKPVDAWFPLHLHALPPGVRNMPLRGMLISVEWRGHHLRYSYGCARVSQTWPATAHERMESFMRQWEHLSPPRWPRCSVLFSVEGADWLGPKKHMARLVAAGLRVVQIYHPNVHSAYISPTAGLTREGKGLLRQLTDFDLWLDLSHLHGPLLRHVLEHACCRRMVSHVVCRQLLAPGIQARANAMDDTELRIADAELYGVPFLDDLLSPRPEIYPGKREVHLQAVAAHVQHLAAVVGGERVALGPDYFSPAAMQAARVRVVPPLAHAGGLRSLGSLLQSLMPPSAVHDVFYGNACRVLLKGGVA